MGVYKECGRSQSWNNGSEKNTKNKKTNTSKDNEENFLVSFGSSRSDLINQIHKNFIALLINYDVFNRIKLDKEKQLSGQMLL